ncbi:MAG TPA: nucleoside hydrolase [Yaniella sp.]
MLDALINDRVPSTRLDGREDRKTHSFLPFPNNDRIPVIPHTDIGSNIDDLLALLFMLGSQRLDLVGVTTVYGDTSLRAKVTRSVLELAGRADVPVGYGIETPLSGKAVFSNCNSDR